MEGVHKIPVVNNETDCLNKSFQLHRFAKLPEWIHKGALALYFIIWLELVTYPHEDLHK